MSRYFRAEIRENRSLNRNHNLLSLANLDPMDEPLPGQFYMLEVNKGYDPLLKRAFGLFRRTPSGLQILYRIKGKGTSIMANMKEGSVIHLLGPLGNGYPLPSDKQTPLVVAGGVGLASLFPLIEGLSEKAHVFYGARTKDELFVLDELGKISRELFTCTDDGSSGRKGTVIDLLEGFLSSGGPQSSSYVIYACGPRPVLEKVSAIAASRSIKAYVSLEEHMACGIGACLGCVVRAKGRKPQDAPAVAYQRVCKEGPVFDSEEIEW